jgi:hypothetical protein
MAVVSHLLFLYSEHLDEAAHLSSVFELLRVAEKVRIFPLVTLERRKVAACRADLLGPGGGGLHGRDRRHTIRIPASRGPRRESHDADLSKGGPPGLIRQILCRQIESRFIEVVG